MTRRDVQHAPDKLSLKLAAEALIDAVGGSSKAAGYCRADQRRLSDYALPNTDAFMPADVKIDLEKRARGSAGWPQATREEARQLGFVLVALPGGAPSRGDVMGMVGGLTREAADVTQALCDALADGRIDAGEAKAIRCEVAEAFAELARIDRQLAALAGDAL